MKIGLYSITYLGCWYRGEALTLPELIKAASKFGYDGVEIDGKRPHGNPLDWPARRCKELRAMADSEGIEILGVAASNDFSNPFPEVREAQVCLDAPLMPDKSPAAMRDAAQAVGSMQVMSHFGGEFERNPDGSITGVDRIDGVITGETNRYYRDFARAMHEIGYRGYISYELCHQLPVVNGETVGIEFAHKNAQLAAEFMREIIKTEYGAKPAKPAIPQPACAA